MSLHILHDLCPACGEVEEQMPETCRNCGWRNWGQA